VFLDVAECFVAYSCGVRVVHCRRVSVRRGAGAGARFAPWSIFFEKNAVLGYKTVRVRVRVRLGLELMSTLTLTLTLTVSKP